MSTRESGYAMPLEAARHVGRHRL